MSFVVNLMLGYLTSAFLSPVLDSIEDKDVSISIGRRPFADSPVTGSPRNICV